MGAKANSSYQGGQVPVFSGHATARERPTCRRARCHSPPPQTSPRERVTSAETCLRVDVLAPELHDEPKLTLSQQRLDRPDDPENAAGIYPLPDLKRPLLRHVTC